MTETGERDGETGETDRNGRKQPGEQTTGMEREVRTKGQIPRPVTDVDKETEGETERQEECEAGEGAGRGRWGARQVTEKEGETGGGRGGVPEDAPSPRALLQMACAQHS